MNLETVPHKYSEEGETAHETTTCWHLSLRFIRDPTLVLPHKTYWAKCGESRFCFFCFNAMSVESRGQLCVCDLWE